MSTRVAKRGISSPFSCTTLLANKHVMITYGTPIDNNVYISVDKNKKSTNSQIYGDERWEMLNTFTTNETRIIIPTMRMLLNQLSYANN